MEGVSRPTAAAATNRSWGSIAWPSPQACWNSRHTPSRLAWLQPAAATAAIGSTGAAVARSIATALSARGSLPSAAHWLLNGNKATCNAEDWLRGFRTEVAQGLLHVTQTLLADAAPSVRVNRGGAEQPIILSPAAR